MDLSEEEVFKLIDKYEKNHYYVPINGERRKYRENDSFYDMYVIGRGYTYFSNDGIRISSPFYIEDYSSYLEKIKNNN